MVAFLLDMSLTSSISSIFAGVVSAGVIMTALTLAGKAGGAAVAVVLAAFAAKRCVPGKDYQHAAKLSPLNSNSNPIPFAQKTSVVSRAVRSKTFWRLIRTTTR